MKKLLLSLLVLALVVLAPTNPSQVGTVQVAQADTTSVIVLDVAFDGATFVLNQVTPGAPDIARGDTFVLNGKIFAGGTIPAGSDFDPNSAGSIGKFICRGTSLYNGAEIASGAAPFVATTQTFLSDNGNALITEGLEAGVSPITRSVTGGWGQYGGVSGDVTLELIGFNITGFENYRCKFTLKKQAPK
jgi:hypothetical protein